MNANLLRVVFVTALMSMAGVLMAAAAGVAPATDKSCPCCNAGCRMAVAATQPACAVNCPLASTKPPVAPAASTPATKPSAVSGEMGRGRMGMGNAGAMRLIHGLLDKHLKITRTVKEIPGGVETVTTSEDPAVARDIAAHVRQMHQRMQAGQPIRMWDPLFVELFRHRDEVRMEIADVPGGVKVTTTSNDPQVTLLIRQHATRGVDEFVAQGWERVHKPTTLPSGYKQTR